MSSFRPEPDLVAFPLESALEALEKKGFELEVRKSYPAKPFPGNGQWRVVRQTADGKKIMLIAAEECEGISP